MKFDGGIPISQLPSVSIPDNSDVLVLNVSDIYTRKITIKSFLDHIQFKLVAAADWAETNTSSPAYIHNKPCVYECNSYIPSLTEIY